MVCLLLSIYFWLIPGADAIGWITIAFFLATIALAVILSVKLSMRRKRIVKTGIGY